MHTNRSSSMKRPTQIKGTLAAPAVDDTEAWKLIIKDKTISDYSLESLLVALDGIKEEPKPKIEKTILDYIYLRIERILKRQFGKAYESEAAFIAREILSEAISDPNCRRGRGLRKAFFGTIKFVVLDAVKEARDELGRQSDIDVLEIKDSDNLNFERIELGIDLANLIVKNAKNISQEDVRKRLNMVYMLYNNMTIDEIARSLQRSPTTIKKWVKEIQSWMIASGSLGG